MTEQEAIDLINQDNPVQENEVIEGTGAHRRVTSFEVRGSTNNGVYRVTIDHDLSDETAAKNIGATTEVITWP